MTHNALVLGGTSFIGRHTVEALVRHGWDVTLFNRGISDTSAFDLPLIVGDRTGDVSALTGTNWDVVVDVSAYHPDDIDRVADVIGNVGHYVFVSTVSVYSDTSIVGMTEDAPLKTLAEVPAEATMELYGELKALAEERVVARFGHRAIIRPCIVAGPYDPTDRFTYWVRTIARPGQHIVPPVLDQSVQVIDVRDLGDFIALVAVSSTTGVFNAVGETLSFGSLLSTIAAVAGVALRPVSIADLAAEVVAPWSDLPLWIPVEPDNVGFFETSGAAAASAGLRLRPLAETVAATLAWDAERGPLLRGLSPEREAELVAKYGMPD